MDAAKILLLAGGALAAAAVVAAAQPAREQPSPTRTKRVPRRRSGTRQQLQQQQQQVAGTQVPTLQLVGQPVYHSALPPPPPPPARAPAPEPEQPTPFLLSLVPLLSLAAVLCADSLRPEEYQDAQEWRQLVATAAVAICTLHLAAAALWAWSRGVNFVGARPAIKATVTAGVTAASVPAHAATAVLAAVPPAAAVPLQDLSGTWVKDRAASDSMEAACDAMHLGGIIRSAIRLIRGLEVRCNGQLFRMSVLSGILWFKVTESYPVNGQPAQWRRRDLRKGKHVGRVQRCPSSGGLLLQLEWGEPHGGSAVDLFRLVEPDVLHVRTDMTVGGTRVVYTQVYRRKGP
ncbi:hypothetical protein ACK3TF_003464 [Chlorella vulgaris]